MLTSKSEWLSLLLDVQKYDFNHTYDSHFIEKDNSETPIMLRYVEGDVIIGLPLLVRNIFDTPYKDATSLWGYGGPISKGVNAEFDNINFLTALKEYFISENIIAVFSRLNPYIQFQKTILNNIGNIIINGKVVYIDLNKDPAEQRKNYQRRLKTYVNKIRRECEVISTSCEEGLRDFIGLYYESMNRVNADKRYYFDYNFINNLFESSDFETELLLVRHKELNKIIAGGIFIKTGDIIQYHLSGVANEFLYLAPTKLLIDEMRVKANLEKKFKYFNLGGGLGGNDNDSLFKFKLSFSKQTFDFELWNWIIDNDVYNKLVEEMKINKNASFFPLYRYEK